MIESKIGQAQKNIRASQTVNDVDWTGLRAAAVAIGIRKAARQAARDLPPDEQERFVQRAMKRCSREKWLVKYEQVKADAVAMSPTALSANVRTGADALANALAEDSQATRIAAARAHRKATEHAANLSGQTLMDKDVAQALKHHDQGAAIVHGWSEMEQAQGAHVAINIAMLSVDPESVRIKHDASRESRVSE
jgi:hypothetical protein